jgi:hypothetical protein
MAFDAQAYLAANPDVAAAGMDPSWHYQNFGQYEGRDPGGATSGAQQNYWDNSNWLSQAGNGGGTRATGIQSSSTPVNLAGNLPGNASFYKAPGQFEGQNFNVGLSAQGWENVQKAVAGGMDFNEAVIRNSGDGIGTAVIMPADSGYLPYGIDVTTGQPLYNTAISGITGRQSGGSSGGATGGTAGGASGGVGGGLSGSGFNSGLNPFQSQMFDAVTNQVTQNLNRNILPGLRSASTATGGYGGSRQGVVEANALNDANQGLSNALAGILYGDWTNSQNRNLSKYGMDQSFYTSQRGQDLQQTGLGASIFQQGMQGMLGQGQGIYNLGLTAQQAPWQTLTGFANTSNPYTGYGSTTQNQAGSAGAGFAGGAILGNQLYNIWR